MPACVVVTAGSDLCDTHARIGMMGTARPRAKVGDRGDHKFVMGLRWLLFSRGRNAADL